MVFWLIVGCCLLFGIWMSLNEISARLKEHFPTQDELDVGDGEWLHRFLFGPWGAKK